MDEIVEHENQFILNGEAYDKLVLAVPLPIAAMLLYSISENRPISNVTYRACISVMLGFSHEIDPPYHAVVSPEQTHPMGWLSIETEKSPHRAPAGNTAMVMQLSAQFSKNNMDKSDEFLVDTACAFTRVLYGPNFDAPLVAHVKRWKYSQPENLARFEAVNQPGSRLLISSDSLLGGRIEESFECGYRVGELIVNG